MRLYCPTHIAPSAHFHQETHAMRLYRIFTGMSLFKNKYRIESARMENWDYGAAGAYFITICTKNREHFFGHIADSDMHLNDMGAIVQYEWLKTPEIRPDMNLTIDEYCVMPNHFHGILLVGDNTYNIPETAVGDTKNKFGPQSKNVSSIVRGFKASATKACRNIHPDFAWQERFHDHIIRNYESYLRIRNYIACNPANWQADKFYSHMPTR